MMRNWTFGRKITTGLVVVVVLVAALGTVSVIALSSVVTSKDHVINVDSRSLIDAETLSAAVSEKSASARAYLLTGGSTYLQQMDGARRSFLTTLSAMRRTTSAQTDATLTTIQNDESAHQRAIETVVALRRQGRTAATLGQQFAALVDPKYSKLAGAISTFIRQGTAQLVAARQASTNDAGTAGDLILLMALVAIVIAILLTVLLPRTLRRQIGNAVGEVNNSSIELQA
ncbi:MAG: CHASE3 domain-containing protein, partial [Acidimicrobiales bacterium]